jgi:hypothetical protein
MIITRKTLALVSIALAASFLSACPGETKKSGKATEILSDKDAAPAAYALIHLQEPPALPVDDVKKPFAAVADREERVPAGDKPLSLQEAKPKK